MQGAVVIDGFEFSFVIEGEVVGAVGDFGGVEYLVANDDAVTSLSGHIHEGVVVLGMINLFAPAVVDGQLVVSVFVGVVSIHRSVEIADGEHIVHTVAIRCDGIREDEVGLEGNRMGNAAVTTLRGEHVQGYVIVAPAGIAVVEGIAGGVDDTVAKVPVKAHVVTEIQGVSLDLEEDGSVGFRPE